MEPHKGPQEEEIPLGESHDFQVVVSFQGSKRYEKPSHFFIIEIPSISPVVINTTKYPTYHSYMGGILDYKYR